MTVKTSLKTIEELTRLAEHYEAQAQSIRTTLALLMANGQAQGAPALNGKLAQAIGVRQEYGNQEYGHQSDRLRAFFRTQREPLRSQDAIAAVGGDTSRSMVRLIAQEVGWRFKGDPVHGQWHPPAKGVKVTNRRQPSGVGNKKRQSREVSVALWKEFSDTPMTTAALIDAMERRGQRVDTYAIGMRLGSLARYGYLKKKADGYVQGKPLEPLA